MLAAFRTAAARLGLLAPRAYVLAAVSGGPDSMALLCLLAERLPPDRLSVAHVNHGTREKASDSDQAFVAAAARGLGLPCVAARLEKPEGRASEERLREARYRALEALARRVGATHLALAHTADDQAETVLLRLARGTGLPGLAGIPERRDLGSLVLVRPLLGNAREDLVTYLGRHRVPFRTDRTNRDPRYARNRVRHRVLPELARINPRVREALVRLSGQAGEAAAFLGMAGELAARRLVRKSRGGLSLSAARLRGLPPALRAEVWRLVHARLAPGKALEADHVVALEEMLGKGKAAGTLALPGSVAVRWAGASLARYGFLSARVSRDTITSHP
jgi:tRNA(Ile)-lysidine synthase